MQGLRSPVLSLAGLAGIASCLAVTFACAAEGPAFMPLNAPGTLVLKGTHPTPLNANTIQATVDASAIGMGDYMSTQRIGLIPEGRAASAFNECPYFKYKSTDRVERDASRPGRFLTITSQLSAAEIAAVKKAQCVITDWPPMNILRKVL